MDVSAPSRGDNDAAGMRDLRAGSVMMWRALWAIAISLFVAVQPGESGAFPLSGDQTILPAGTELGEDSFYRPSEVFHSETSGGFKSYMIDLGDLALDRKSTV